MRPAPMATFAPSRANRNAVAAPSPELPPVMRMTLSLKDSMPFRPSCTSHDAVIVLVLPGPTSHDRTVSTQVPRRGIPFGFCTVVSVGAEFRQPPICVSEHPFSGTPVVAEDESSPDQSNKLISVTTAAEGKAIRNPAMSSQRKSARHSLLLNTSLSFGRVKPQSSAALQTGGMIVMFSTADIQTGPRPGSAADGLRGPAVPQRQPRVDAAPVSPASHASRADRATGAAMAQGDAQQ